LKALIAGVFSLIPLMAAGEELPEISNETLGRPLTYRIGQEILIDSNVLRLPDGQTANASLGGNQRNDVISRTYGGITYNNLLANQTVRLDLSADLRRYSSFSSLNRNTFGFVGSLGGDLNRAWYYDLSLNSSSIAGDFVNQTGFESNLVRSLGWRGRLGFRFTPTWSTYIDLTNTDRTNSAPTLAASNTEQSSTELGVRFDPGSALSTDLGLSRRKVDYPNRQTLNFLGNPLPASVNNSFQSDQLIARVNYKPTGRSVFSGNIGIGRTSFDELTQRDARSVLLDVNYRFILSGLAELGLQFARDFGTGTLSFSSPVLSTRFGVNAIWRPTGRLSLVSQISVNNRRFNADPSFAIGAAGTLSKDQLRSIGVTATYDLSHAVRLNGGVNYQSRNADVKNFSFNGSVISVGMTVNFD
jgi:Putative beta-barrel porin 2